MSTLGEDVNTFHRICKFGVNFLICNMDLAEFDKVRLDV